MKPLFAIAFPAVVICGAAAAAEVPVHLSIAATGAVADGETVNTDAIQSAIDRLAGADGGTVVIPEGVFLSGALDLKPGVHLHLEAGAVLRATTDMAHFPPRPTRIEGQTLEFTPALINADGCDGLRITGEGTLDGDGREIWDEFWRRRRAAEDYDNFPNLSVERARLALISNSRDVRISDLTFKDSQFWNLHLYRCREVVVDGCGFEVPDDYRQAPSSDGIDVDSCQDVTIENCRFSITDDAIALKGTKGPRAHEDESSPPVERIRIRNCTFQRAHGMLTCGSEATIVRDVVLEDCVVLGGMPLLKLKLRLDTVQRYQDITIRDLEVDNGGATLFAIGAWSQYSDLQGQVLPPSVVSGIHISSIRGRIGGLGRIAGHDRAEISGIKLENIDVEARSRRFNASDRVDRLAFEKVRINGEPFGR